MNRNLDEIIIAHRGESFIAPENTLAAINLAWENGVKAVEIDVQLTADNHIVVIHDFDTKRLGDNNLTVINSTLQQLRRIDVGAYKGENYKGETIPTLNEVIDTIPKGCRLIIEIKSGLEIVEPLAEIINAIKEVDKIIEVISFKYDVLVVMKKQLPNIPMLWLLDLDYYFPFWLVCINKKKIRNKLTQGNLDGVNVWAGKVINKDFVAFFKKYNLTIYAWTVNDIKQAQKLLEMGIDAITTDRAQWLSKQLLKG